MADPSHSGGTELSGAVADAQQWAVTGTVLDSSRSFLICLGLVLMF